MKKNAITTDDVPMYVRDILKRSLLIPEPYRIKIYSRNKCGGEVGFQKEIERLIKWCKRWYAEAEIVEWGMWMKYYKCRSSAFRAHHHNYVILDITDPVMHRFEKDNFYKQ